MTESINHLPTVSLGAWHVLYHASNPFFYLSICSTPYPTLLADLTLQTEQSVSVSLLGLCGFVPVCPHVCTCMSCPEANFSYCSFLRCLSLYWHCPHHKSASQVLGLQAHITMPGFLYL